MEEVYSDECQPGIKYSFNKSLITSSYAKDLQHVWQPLHKYTMEYYYYYKILY